MKTVKLIICKGLPGSGKTTWAKGQTKIGHTVRVNRDDTRKMLCADYQFGNHQMETIVTETNLVTITSALKSGLNVIVDDTNLNPKTVKTFENLVASFKDDVKVNFSIQDFTHVPIKDCIYNDAGRPDKGRVGEGVIRRMAMRAGLHPTTSNRVILVDFDGTIADIETRRKKSMRSDGKVDYSKFFSSVLIETDTPRLDIMNEIKLKSEETGADILIVSGRAEGFCKESRFTTYDTSVEWLYQHNFSYPMLNRKQGDNRPDEIIKKEMLDDIRKCWPEIVCVYDDRLKVRKMWEAEGLTVRDCSGPDGGDF